MGVVFALFVFHYSLGACCLSVMVMGLIPIGELVPSGLGVASSNFMLAHSVVALKSVGSMPGLLRNFPS